MLNVRPFTRLTKVIYFSDKVFLYVSITTTKTYFIFLFYLYLFCLFILKRVTACMGRVLCIVCCMCKFQVCNLASVSGPINAKGFLHQTINCILCVWAHKCQRVLHQTINCILGIFKPGLKYGCLKNKRIIYRYIKNFSCFSLFIRINKYIN